MSCVPIEKKKAGRKERKFLVYWYPVMIGKEGSVSVERSARIPQDCRKQGATARLKWPEKGADQREYNVKILQTGENEDELYAISVNAYTGEILSAQDRAFTAPVMAKRKEMAAQRRLHNPLQRSKGLKMKLIDFVKPPIFEEPSSKKLCVSNKSALPETADVNSGAPTRKQPDPCSSTTSLSCNGNPSRSASIVPSNMPTIADVTAEEKFCPEAMVFKLDSILPRHCSWERLEAFQDILKNLQAMTGNCTEMKAIQSFFYCLVQRMEKLTKEKVNEGWEKPRVVKLSSEYFEDGPNKTKLFPNVNFFVDNDTYTVINLRKDTSPGWKSYTDVVLQEIYQDDLRWLSASGLRGTQGIHHKLRQGLLAYAQAMEEGVTAHKFTEHVNHLLSNKKASWRRKFKGSAPKKSKNDSVSTLNKTLATDVKAPDQGGDEKELHQVDPLQSDQIMLQMSPDSEKAFLSSVQLDLTPAKSPSNQSAQDTQFLEFKENDSVTTVLSSISEEGTCVQSSSSSNVSPTVEITPTVSVGCLNLQNTATEANEPAFMVLNNYEKGFQSSAPSTAINPATSLSSLPASSPLPSFNPNDPLHQILFKMMLQQHLNTCS